MDFKENDNHSLSKKDEIQEAVEQLFYNSLILLSDVHGNGGILKLVWYQFLEWI